MRRRLGCRRSARRTASASRLATDSDQIERIAQDRLHGRPVLLVVARAEHLVGCRWPAQRLGWPHVLDFGAARQPSPVQEQRPDEPRQILGAVGVLVGP
jgi:hypothetical protein